MERLRIGEERQSVLSFLAQEMERIWRVGFIIGNLNIAQPACGQITYRKLQSLIGEMA
jgi:hypothetical protein